MPINVICPGCHKRFTVADKFAGKKGPCPACKKPITIPAAGEQIKIQEQEYGGQRGTSGQLVGKPLERAKFKARPLMIAAVVVPVLAVLVTALIFRGTDPQDESWWLWLSLGAVALAPPLVFGGYTFLRDDEKDPYRGTELLIRVAICSVIYALLWGGFALVPPAFRTLGSGEMSGKISLDAKTPDTEPASDAGFTADEASGKETSDLMTLAIVILPFLVAGAVTAYVSLDLDLSSSAFHYLLYLITCILGRILAGLPPI